MSYQVLARKWRPRRFTELVGQEHVVRALSHALDGGRIHHAFLFTGTRGVGKTTIARIFAKSLNCERGPTSDPCGTCGACTEIDAGRFVDLLEIDAASNTGIDNVRELIDNAQYAPARGAYKVYLIDEVHMLSKAAFNALLKTLEEPPPHVKFLLATTDPQRLPVTVLSRCIKFNLKRLTPEQIVGQMRHILDAEGIAFEDEAIDVLSRAADGSLRDGLSLLDQAIAHGGGALRAGEVHAMLGTVERARVRVLLDALVAHDAGALLAEIERIAEFAPDFAQVLDELAGLLHRVQLAQLVAGTGDESTQALAAHIDAREVQLYYQMAITGRRDLALAPTARVGFEMALLRMLAFAPAGPGGGARVAAPTASSGAAAAAAAFASHGAPAPASPPPRAVKADATHESARVVPFAPPQAPVAPPPAAAPVQAAPAQRAIAPAASSMPLDVGDWPDLVRRADLGGPVGQLAMHAVLIGVDGDTLRLGIKPGHEHFVAPPITAQLEKRLGEALGRIVRIRIEKADNAAQTPADHHARQQATRQQAAHDGLRDDPLVQSLIDTFDARIVRDSVRPLEK